MSPFIFATSLGISVSAAVCLTGAAYGADLRSCEIDRLSGDHVLVILASGTMAGAPGQDIPAAAVLETGSSSRVVVRCDDGTTITLGPDTRLELDTLVGDSGPDRTVLMRLVNGITGIVAPNRTWDQFQVETSVAIASVRSTEWVVESDPETGTAVFVALGSVDVLARQLSFVLMEGEGVTLPPELLGATPADIPQVISWGDGRIARSREALGFDWE